MLRLNGIESEMEEKKSQSTTSKLSKRGSILFLKANKLVRLQKSKDLDKTVESVANGSGRSSARKKRKKPYLTNVQAVRSSTTNAATSSNDNNNNASKLEQSSKDELEDVSSKLAPTSLPYHGKLSRTVNNKEGEEVEEEEEVEVDADADAEPVSGITTFSSREVEDLPEADIDRPEARLRLSLPPGRLQRSYSGRIKNPSNENSPHKETPHESAVPSAGTGTGTGSSLGMSPRKQSIMRYKQIDDDLDNTLISEAKGNLRNSLILEDSNISAMNTLNNPPPTLNLDDKVSIFIYHTSKVLVYHEQAQTKHGGTTEDPKTSGRLLGHGTLEIFQLHNGDVTYLSCGSSFVYPLLPKLKILRISFDTFILPLVNPERYWKILVETGEEDVIAKLEAILKDSVKYTNLYFGPPPTPVIHSKKSDRPHITKVVTDSAKPEKTTSIDNDEIITTTDTVQNLFHSVADIDRAKHKLNNHSAISHIFENSGTVNGNLSSSIPIAATTSGRIVHPSQQNYDHTSDLKSSSTTPAPEYPSEALIAMSLNISDIPDSPPSAPMSPSQVDKLQAFDITPSKLQNGNSDWSIKRQASTNSFTTNIACLDINDSPNLTRHYTSNRIEPPRMTVPAQYNIQQPKPQRMKNPNSFAGQLKHPHYNDSNHSSQLQLQNQNQLQHKKQQQYNRINTAVSNHDDGDSSDSSMDSLIDEYEENISTTKSIHLGSRPPSRAQSRASTNYNANGGVQYNRPAYFQGKLITMTKISQVRLSQSTIGCTMAAKQNHVVLREVVLNGHILTLAVNLLNHVLLIQLLALPGVVNIMVANLVTHTGKFISP